MTPEGLITSTDLTSDGSSASHLSGDLGWSSAEPRLGNWCLGFTFDRRRDDPQCGLGQAKSPTVPPTTQRRGSNRSTEW
jgi:hypothetical protein